LARHARKRRPGAVPSAPPRPSGPARRADARHDVAAEDAREDDAITRGYARGRERDEAARAALKPLEPGERPWPIVASAALAALVAIANVILVLTGWDGNRTAALVFAAVMLAAAVGMWNLKYWAVLGFEVLLGVSFAFALLALLRAENLEAVAQCVVGMLITGPLFYFLIRQMARIQMPERR
jgi:hypothetical protein